MKTDEFCEKYGFSNPGFLLGPFVKEIKEAYIQIKNEQEDQENHYIQIIGGLRDEKGELQDSYYELKKLCSRLGNKIRDIESSDVNGLRVLPIEVLEETVTTVISNSGRRLFFEDENFNVIEVRRHNETLRSKVKKLNTSLGRAKDRYSTADRDLEELQKHCAYYVKIEDYEKGEIRDAMLPFDVKYGNAKIAEILFRKGRYMIVSTSLTEQHPGVLFVGGYDFSKTRKKALDLSTDTQIKMGHLRFSMRNKEDAEHKTDPDRPY